MNDLSSPQTHASRIKNIAGAREAVLVLANGEKERLMHELFLDPEQAPSALGTCSQGIKPGNRLITSGQIGIDRTTVATAVKVPWTQENRQ